MSQALEQFQKTFVYHNEAPAAEILDDLAAIGEIDKAKEAEAKKSGLIGCLMVPLAMIGIPLTVAYSPYVGIPLLIAGAIAAVFQLTKAYRAHKRNVEDRRYQLMQAIVDLLRRDVAPETPLTVMLSLRPVDSKANFQGEDKRGHWNCKHFVDGWLQLDVKLLDGTACRVLATEKRQNRHRWKTSASGKSKLKQKTKSALEVAVRLKPKAHRYTKLDEIRDHARGAVQLPNWGVLKGLDVQEGGLLIKAGTKSDWDAARKGETGRGPHAVHLVAMMMLSLYQVLNLSRAVTKAEKER